MILCPNANLCCKNAMLETALINKDKGGRFFTVLEKMAVQDFLRDSSWYIIVATGVELCEILTTQVLAIELPLYSLWIYS